MTFFDFETTSQNIREHSKALSGSLGGVDKFEPVSSGGEMDHAEETVGQLIVAGGDCAIDLEVAEHALDAVALLVERPVMIKRWPGESGQWDKWIFCLTAAIVAA